MPLAPDQGPALQREQIPAPIYLIGGASGTGKTRISYPVAKALGLPIVEIDDIVEALLATTTPVQLPTIHYWTTHPEAADLPPEAIVELHITMAHALVPAIAAVIGNHLETNTPVVVEGDYLLPSFAVQRAFAGQPADGRVRAIFLVEPDEPRLAANFLSREGASGDQSTRAKVSRLFGEWLARESGLVGLPVVSARPWESATDRVLAALLRP